MLLLLACVSTETGEPGFGAHAADAQEEASLEVSASLGVGTHLTVTTDFPEPVTTWVEFGPDDSYGYHTPLTPREGAATISVLGLPAAAAWHWRVVASGASGARYASADQTIQLPSAPASLPTYHLSAQEGPIQPDWILAPLTVEGWIAIYNRAGQPVWWTDFPADQSVVDAHLSRDGRAIYYVRTPAMGSFARSALVKVDLETHQVEEKEIPYTHHGFTELPDGRIALLVAEARPASGGQAVGDTLQILSSDGQREVVWTVWDEETPEIPPDGAGVWFPEGYDWSHCNSVSYDEGADQFLVSCYNLGAIYAIDGQGGLRWKIGGASDGQLSPAAGEAIERAHSPTLLSEGRVLLFDNRGSWEEELFSQVVELQVNEGAGTYQIDWADDAGGDRFTYALGDAQRLDDGHTLSFWGNLGMIREVDAEGRVVWQIDREAGGVVGFGERIEALGAGL